MPDADVARLLDAPVQQHEREEVGPQRQREAADRARRFASKRQQQRQHDEPRLHRPQDLVGRRRRERADIGQDAIIGIVRRSSATRPCARPSSPRRPRPAPPAAAASPPTAPSTSRCSLRSTPASGLHAMRANIWPVSRSSVGDLRDREARRVGAVETGGHEPVADAGCRRMAP